MNNDHIGIGSLYVNAMNVFVFLLLVNLVILPEGSVRDEGVFFTLVFILVVFIIVAIYLRRKNR